MIWSPTSSVFGFSAVQVALAINVGLFLLSFATVLTIAGLHRHFQRGEKLQATLFARWRPLVAQYLAGGDLDPELKQGARKHPESFLDLTTKQALVLRGPTYVRLQTLVAVTGLSSWLRARLGSSSPKNVAEAARAMAVLHDEDSRDELRNLIHSRHTAVAFAAALALARIANAEDLRVLFRMLSKHTIDHQDLALLVLVACSESNPEQFATVAREQGPRATPEFNALVIEVIGHTQLQGVEDLLRQELLSPTSDEGQLKALRALGETESVDSARYVRQFLTCDRWEARAIAAWTVGKLGDRRSITTLRMLLADQQWSVRLNAACSLSSLGGPGMDALSTAARTAQDPFARDAAAHALGRTRQTVPIL